MFDFKDWSTKQTVTTALIAALYVVLTVTPPLNSISYGAYQFRISEMIVFMAFVDRRYIWGLTLGCMLANFFSFGLIDVIVGGAQTLIFVTLGVILFDRFKHQYILAGKLNLAYFLFSLLFSFSMFVIAIELNIVAGLPILMTWFTTAVGEFASLLVGAFLMDILIKRLHFMD